ncbi:MAG: hypothetical protein EXR50_06655, partial [Dehalococcoidia bacterium]|nr:hypothetical protein [Dehalococcoidia bacterium]
MGIEAARLTADGRDVFPRSGADWTDWVSAGRTRNFVLGDPLLDWLELYGAAHGFLRDEQLPGYDSRLDFTEFNFRQGASFEAAVLAHLRGLTRIESISKGVEDNRSFAKAEETFEAMRLGVPAVYQGVMFDAQARAYGAPDLLVRADVLQRLFPAVNISDPDRPAAD